MTPRLLPALSAFVLVASGCPGRLNQAEIASFGDGSFCPPGMTAESIFQEHCGGSVCHGAGDTPAGELDLISPNVEERMALVPSTECEGETLVVPGEPDESVLYWKVTRPPDGCGDPMPVLGRLTPSEMSCIRFWIREMNAPASPDGGTP